MLSVFFVVSILIEIVFPFVLAAFLVRRYRRGWALVGVGALTFVASQIIHLPLVGLWNAALQSFSGLSITAIRILNALMLGLLAGLCEETARWAAYRLLKKRGNTWGSALTLGAGHGGIESVLLAGLPVLSTFVVMHLVRSGIGVPGITPDMAVEYFSMSWALPLAGAVERLMSIALHITLSVMVWLAVRDGKLQWFAAAVGWHAFIDAVVVSLGSFTGKVWLIEGVLAIFTAANLYFLWRISRDQNADETAAVEAGDDEKIV